jgi:integrase/recombinase XerC
MLDRFEAYLRSVNMSENTVRSYGNDVRQFLRFVESRNIGVKDVDHQELLDFLGYLTEKNLRSSTRRRKMEAVKTFYRAMCRMGELEDDPFAGFHEMPRVRDSNMRVLTEMEYRSLRDVVRGSRRKSSVRDYAILELALQTGLRISEICSLSVGDIQPSTRTTAGHVTVRKGKGGKERTVTLNDAAERALRGYMGVRPKGTGHSELFLNNRMKPCQPVAVSGVFKRYMEKAGIAGATFHSLRHTFATHSLNMGTNIIVVQEALGHESLTTTQKYVHFLREMMDRQLTKNIL